MITWLEVDFGANSSDNKSVTSGFMKHKSNEMKRPDSESEFLD